MSNVFAPAASARRLFICTCRTSGFTLTNVQDPSRFDIVLDPPIRKIGLRYRSGSCSCIHWLSRRQHCLSHSTVGTFTSVSTQVIGIKDFRNFSLVDARGSGFVQIIPDPEPGGPKNTHGSGTLTATIFNYVTDCYECLSRTRSKVEV